MADVALCIQSAELNWFKTLEPGTRLCDMIDMYTAFLKKRYIGESVAGFWKRIESLEVKYGNKVLFRDHRFVWEDGEKTLEQVGLADGPNLFASFSIQEHRFDSAEELV
mmetsp:Transcript_12081/g.23311  ORF Transcript_12081/g.23311 Transcript_12081/m.23311 type:complete len:109 (+) Transcript_12081:218-544(+)